jgi:GNAT superfamily N-acetyltransferase
MLLRPAVAADGPAFVALVRALAEFEKLTGPDDDAAARLVADFTATPPRYELMVAEKDGELVAYAAHFMTYSTFRARPTLFLEDLFVHPRARRQGVARAMLDRLRALAEERGCGRFEWFVLDWNEDAQKLYQQVGAKQIPSWVLCRVDLPDKIAG